MVNELIQEQLKKVEYADLSNFNEQENTYYIKKRVDIKIEEDCCYLIQLKKSARNNQTVLVNWNNGSMPLNDCLKIDVAKKMGKMIKVVSVGYDRLQNIDLGNFWSGWLCIDDLDIISKL